MGQAPALSQGKLRVVPARAGKGTRVSSTPMRPPCCAQAQETLGSPTFLSSTSTPPTLPAWTYHGLVLLVEIRGHGAGGQGEGAGLEEQSQPHVGHWEQTRGPASSHIAPAAASGLGLALFPFIRLPGPMTHTQRSCVATTAPWSDSRMLTPRSLLRRPSRV